MGPLQREGLILTSEPNPVTLAAGASWPRAPTLTREEEQEWMVLGILLPPFRRTTSKKITFFSPELHDKTGNIPASIMVSMLSKQRGLRGSESCRPLGPP